MPYDLEKIRRENPDQYGKSSHREIASDLFSHYQNDFKAMGINSVDDWAAQDGLGEAWDRDDQKVFQNKRQAEMDTIRTQNRENMGFFSRSVARGVQQTQAMGYGALGLAGAATGLEGVKKAGIEGYQRNIEEASLYPGTEFDEIGEAKGLGKVGKGAQWAVEKLGENLPILAGTILTGGAGGIAGKALPQALSMVLKGQVRRELARNALKMSGGKLTNKAIKSQITKGMIGRASKESLDIAQGQVLQTIGSRAGLGLGMGALESGGMFGDVSERGFDDREAALKSLGFGMAAGAVELLGGIGPKALNAMFGKSKSGVVGNAITKLAKLLEAGKLDTKTMRFLGRRIAGAADNAPQEFAQESMQELLGLMNIASNDPTFEVFSQENVDQLIESGFAGAAVGGLLGGAAGPSKYSKIKEQTDVVEESAKDNQATAAINTGEGVAIDEGAASSEIDDTQQTETEKGIAGAIQSQQPKDIIDKFDSEFDAEYGKLTEVQEDESGNLLKTKIVKEPESLPEPLPTKDTMAEIEGSYVDYNGAKGFLRKTKDGYQIVTPEEDIFVESGESELSPGELGITKEKSPTVRMSGGVPQKKQILDKFGAYDPQNETLVTKDGKTLSLREFNYDGGKIVSATFKNEAGEKRTIRNKNVIEYINRVQSLYKEVNYGEGKIQYDAAEGSDWNEAARSIDEEIQRSIAKKPEEEIEFDMHDELANGGWLKKITKDETIEIAEDLGVNVKNKNLFQIKAAIAKKSRRWLELWEAFDDIDTFSKDQKAVEPGAKKITGRQWDSKDGKRTVVGKAEGRPPGWYEIETEGQGHKTYKHETDIEKEIAFDTKNLESRKKRDAESDKKEAKKSAIKKEREDVDGFTDNASPMSRGKIIKTLSMIVRYEGKAISRRDLIRKRVNDGYFINDSNQLESPDGSFLGAKQLTKTGIDYAKHLIKIKQPSNKKTEIKQELEEKGKDVAVKGSNKSKEVQKEQPPDTVPKEITGRVFTKRGWKPFKEYREIKRGKKKGKAEVKIRVMKNGKMEWVKRTFEKKDIKVNLDDAVFQVQAAHGSASSGPAKEGFKSKYMLTGEGVNAFGYGFYFSDLVSIAKEYAKSIIPESFRGAEVGPLLDSIQYRMDKLPIKSDSFRRLQERYQVTEDIAVGRPKNILLEKYDNIEFTEETRRFVKSIKDSEVGGKNLYKVTLHKGKKPGEYAWLDWDGVVTSGTFNNVLSGIKKEGLRQKLIDSFEYVDNWKDAERTLREGDDGNSLYQNLSIMFNSDKEASMFLLRAGIDGIRYPVGSLSGMKDKGAKNYVVFDENAITIDEHIQYQIQGPERQNIENLEITPQRSKAIKALIRRNYKIESPSESDVRDYLNDALTDKSLRAPIVKSTLGEIYVRVLRTEKRDADNRIPRSDELKKIQEALGKDTRIVEAKTAEEKATREIVEALGIKTEYLDTMAPINGVMFKSDPNTIYLSKTSSRPLIAVAGHEVNHILERTEPELFKFMSDTLDKHVKNFDQWVKRYNAARDKAGYPEVSRAQAKEELYGDFIGDSLLSKPAWAAMIKENPTLAKRLARAIITILKRIQRAITRHAPASYQYFDNIAEAQKVVGEVLGKAAGKQGRAKAKTERIKTRMDSFKVVKGKADESVSKEDIRKQVKDPEDVQQFSSADYPALKDDTISGLKVLKDVPNIDSISSTIDEYTILDGVRELKMSGWNASPTDTFSAADDIKRVRELSSEIKKNKKISPLIVAIENGEPYILEGVHRLSALHEIGAKSFPAVVVVDKAIDPEDVVLQLKDIQTAEVRQGIKKIFSPIAESETYKNFMHTIVDKNIAIQEVQKRIGGVREAIDVFMQETQRPKVTAYLIDKFWDGQVKPFIDAAAKAGLEIPAIEKLAHALHAPEANKSLREAAAKEQIQQILIIPKLDKKLKKDLRTAMDIADEETEGSPAGNLPVLESFLDKHGDKAPANRDYWYGKKGDPGFRDKASGMTDEEAGKIVKEYKDNKAAHDLVDMISDINNEKLGLLLESGQISVKEYDAFKNKYDNYVPLNREGYDGNPTLSTGRGLQAPGQAVKTRAGSLRDVENIFANSVRNMEMAIVRAEKARSAEMLKTMISENPAPGFWSLTKTKKEPFHDAMGNLQHYPSMKTEPNEMAIKVNGERYVIQVSIDDKTAMRMLETLKGESVSHGPLVNAFSKVNRYLSAINTMYAPGFILSNFFRDMQTAGVNIKDTGLSSIQMLKGVKRSISTVYKVESGRGNLSAEEEALYKRFKAAGGKISWMDIHKTASDLSKKINAEYEHLSGKRPVRTNIRKWNNFWQAMNTSVENGARFSAFKLAVESGKSDKKAAQIASDLTVDFTKKGSKGQVFNSLYLFANAGVQGSYRMIRALKHPKVQQMAGGIVAVGFLAGAWNDMQGDDDEIEDYLKERNIVLKIPGSDKNIKIPLPWGFNVFFNLGDEIAKATFSDKYDPIKGAARMVSVMGNSFNPLQAGTVLQTLSPTIMDPFAMVGENKNWFGAPLAPTKNPFEKAPTPDSQRYWRSVSTPSKWIAETLNSLTGGDKAVKGAIDVSPETLDLAIDQVGGSALRFVKDIGLMPGRIVRDELDIHRIPFLRRVTSQNPEYASQKKYYKSREEIYIAEKQAKIYPNKRSENIKLIRMKSSVRKTEKRVKVLKNRLRLATDKQSKRTIESRINLVYKNFVEKYNKVAEKP